MPPSPILHLDAGHKLRQDSIITIEIDNPRLPSRSFASTNYISPLISLSSTPTGHLVYAYRLVDLWRFSWGHNYGAR